MRGSGSWIPPPRTRRRLAPALLMAILLGAAFPPPGYSQVGPDFRYEPLLRGGVSYVWWDDDWHFRVPVVVYPRIPDKVLGGKSSVHEVQNYPVQVSVDFTEAVRRVSVNGFSWPTDPLRSLVSFRFDVDSPRVVQYDRDTGATIPTGLGSQTVPSLFAPGAFDVRPGQQGSFEPSRNAVGTLTWIAEGLFTSPRLYFVYFDIEQNGGKAPPAYSEREREPLDALFWIRSGTEFYGYVPANKLGQKSSLEIIGLYDNTAVQLAKYALSGLEPEPLPLAEQGRINRLDGDHGSAEYRVDPSRPFRFRVLANKPVVVTVRMDAPPDWPGAAYPSRDEGLVGREFFFKALGSQHAFVAPQNSAQITVTNLDSPEDSFPLSVARRAASPPSELSAGERYHVTSTQPVAVFGLGEDYRFGQQAVSLWGGPIGTTLFGPRAFDFSAIAWDAATEVTGFETSDPCLNVVCIVDGSAGAGAAGRFYSSSGGEGRAGSIWGFTAASPISVLAGDRGHIPIGGRAGMTYELYVPRTTRPDAPEPESHAQVFGVFNQTRVTVTDGITGSVICCDDLLHRNAWVERRRGSSVHLMPQGPYRIVADKPVLVSVLGENNDRYASAYQGISTAPDADVGEAEYFGHLIRFASRSLTGTFKPEDDAKFTLEIVNLGRALGGGDQPDDVELGFETTGAWPVRLSSALESGLHSFEKRSVDLTIEIPKSARTNDVMQVVVTAASKGNPRIIDTALVTATVQTRFEFEMKFVANAKKAIQRVVEAGSSTEYTISIKNTGTGDDLVRLDVSPPIFGFSGALRAPDGTDLVDATGRGTVPLALKEGEEKLLRLNVSTPAVESPLPFEAVVQGVSENDASASDLVVATTLINIESSLHLELPDETVFVRPGSTTLFPVTVVNDGRAARVQLSVAGALPSGWNVSFETTAFELRENGSRDPISGAPFDRRTVNLSLTPPAGGTVGSRVVMKLTATSVAEGQEGLPGDAAVLRAVVGNNFSLLPEFTPARTLSPGEALDIPLRVLNGANGPLDVLLYPAELPPGWSYSGVTPAPRTVLAPGDLASFTVRVEPASSAAPLGYNVSVGLQIEDTILGRRDLQFVNVTVGIKREESVRITLAETNVSMFPASQLRINLTLRNTGNVNLVPRLEVLAPPGWGGSLPDLVLRDMGPGESVDGSLVLRSPASSEKAPSEIRIRAHLSSGERDFPLSVQLIQNDLAVVSVTPSGGPFVPGEPVTFLVAVRNNGTVPVNNVEVALLVDGTAVVNATVGSIPPGELRGFALPWTVLPGQHTIRAAVDPSDRLSEFDETNNVLTFSEARTPGFEPALLLLAALAAGAVLRRAPGRRGP